MSTRASHAHTARRRINGLAQAQGLRTDEHWFGEWSDPDVATERASSPPSPSSHSRRRRPGAFWTHRWCLLSRRPGGKPGERARQGIDNGL
jgi:hypothetical protein